MQCKWSNVFSINLLPHATDASCAPARNHPQDHLHYPHHQGCCPESPDHLWLLGCHLRCVATPEADAVESEFYSGDISTSRSVLGWISKIFLGIFIPHSVTISWLTFDRSYLMSVFLFFGLVRQHQDIFPADFLSLFLKRLKYEILNTCCINIRQTVLCVKSTE